jgi:hypothetical protein
MSYKLTNKKHPFTVYDFLIKIHLFVGNSFPLVIEFWVIS